MRRRTDCRDESRSDVFIPPLQVNCLIWLERGRRACDNKCARRSEICFWSTLAWGSWRIYIIVGLFRGGGGGVRRPGRPGGVRVECV